MNSDSFFYKGANHTVCQDYAIASDGLVILSDGCSSSPDTDFGSRILVKSFHKLITEPEYIVKMSINELNILQETLVLTARSAVENLGLSQFSLDATLLFATKDIQYCFGDGAIALIFKDKIVIHQIKYPSGAPLYLNYLLNSLRLTSYIKEFGCTRIVKISIIDRATGALTSEPTFIEDTNIGPYILRYMEPDITAIMSDGIESFDEKDEFGFRTPIDIETIVNKLLSFKIISGQFVERRTKAFMKECSRLSWENFDDVSIAAIHNKL